jgi:hypothetical protein
MPLFTVIPGKNMKKVFAAIIILSCIVLVACKKKSNTGIGYSVKPPKGLDSLVSMSAKVNGQGWSTDSAFAYKSFSTIDSNKVSLMVTATQLQNGQASTITFTISNYHGVNTYPVDPPNVSATYYLGNSRHYASAGQVIVTSDNAYGILGTLNFTADSTNVSECTFNAAQP